MTVPASHTLAALFHVNAGVVRDDMLNGDDMARPKQNPVPSLDSVQPVVSIITTPSRTFSTVSASETGPGAFCTGGSGSELELELVQPAASTAAASTAPIGVHVRTESRVMSSRVSGRSIR